MDMREPEVRRGKMCAWQAMVGRLGRWMLAVWLEIMLLPSGSVTEMPGLASFLSV